MVNIDESIFNEADTRYRKWRFKGQVNSQRKRQISPSLSIIAAVSSDGNSYAALSQINTDSESFCLFMWKLVSKLQQERPNFR